MPTDLPAGKTHSTVTLGNRALRSQDSQRRCRQGSAAAGGRRRRRGHGPHLPSVAACRVV